MDAHRWSEAARPSHENTLKKPERGESACDHDPSAPRRFLVRVGKAEGQGGDQSSPAEAETPHHGAQHQSGGAEGRWDSCPTRAGFGERTLTETTMSRRRWPGHSADPDRNDDGARDR